MDAIEIIRQLEGDPGLRAQMRAVLLGDELIELPNLIRQLVRAQERTEMRIQELQEAMELRFVALEVRLERHDARFDQMDARFDRVEGRLDQMDARFDGIDARLDGIDGRFDRVEGRLGTIEADLGDLKGRSIEDRVRSDPRRYVPSRISRRVRAVTADEADEILDHLGADEADEVARADALIRATGADGTEVVFVVEAAWHVHGDDIERAVRRATLARRAGIEAAAMVISQRVPHESVLGRARQLGVVVVAEPSGLLVPAP